MPSRPLATPRRGRIRARLLASVAALALLGAGAFWVARRAERVTPPELLGAPIRVTDAGGDAAFLLTGQWRTHVLRTGRTTTSPRTWTDLHVDLWRFDPATARPVWRRRLLTERDGAKHELSLLGVDGGTLWLFVRGPLAVSLADGRILATADTIEARTPALRRLLPREARYYALGAHGLTVTAADARTWRVDGATLAARPAARPASRTAAGDSATRTRVTWPAYFTPSATSVFQARGLSLPGRWLGVLAEEEAERFRVTSAAARDPNAPRGALAEHEASVHGPPPADFSAPRRHRLWSARVTPVSRAPRGWPRDFPDNWGTRDTYSDIAPLPESPEFLQGGLLTVGSTNAPPLLVRDPDGVLVLHRDRLGEEGKLRLTRVAGPGGRAVWESALPLSVLQAVLPPPPGGGRALVLVGREYQPAGRQPRDPYHGAHERVVAVDLVTGAAHAYDLTAQGRGAPAGR